MLFSLHFLFLCLYLDKYCQVKEKQMDYLGSKIRELREDKGLLLRQLAADMDIDTALLSKIERGDRRANREQVEKASKVLSFSLDELIVLWLADRIADAIQNEPLGKEAINLTLKDI